MPDGGAVDVSVAPVGDGGCGIRAGPATGRGRPPGVTPRRCSPASRRPSLSPERGRRSASPRPCRGARCRVARSRRSSPRSAARAASGSRDPCPAASSSRAPAIAAAVSRRARGGISLSASPWMTSVGALMVAHLFRCGRRRRAPPSAGGRRRSGRSMRSQKRSRVSAQDLRIGRVVRRADHAEDHRGRGDVVLAGRGGRADQQP